MGWLKKIRKGLRWLRRKITGAQKPYQTGQGMLLYRREGPKGVHYDREKTFLTVLEDPNDCWAEGEMRYGLQDLKFMDPDGLGGTEIDEEW